MKNEYECIVVGGGVAGSSAACHLARKGYQVALIERTSLPHHKVCGEFISFEAIEYLQSLGIHLDNYPAIRHLNLVTPQSEIHFQFPSLARGISRFKLDEWIIEKAKEAGVSVIRGVTMKSFCKEKIFKVSTTSEDFFASHLFIATGKYDYDAQSRRLGKDNSYLGFKAHLSIPSQELKESIMLFTFPGGYGGLSPVENGRINFCFVIKKEFLKSFKDFNQSVAYMRRCNRKLESILNDSQMIEGPFAIGYIPYGFLRLSGFENDVYYIGDQRMVIPSFTGDGIAIALNTSLTTVEEFDRRQKGKGGFNSRTVRSLRHQMHWAMRGHGLLKTSITPLLCNMPLCGRFVIKTIFQQTRVEPAKETSYES